MTVGKDLISIQRVGLWRREGGREERGGREREKERGVRKDSMWYMTTVLRVPVQNYQLWPGLGAVTLAASRLVVQIEET